MYNIVGLINDTLLLKEIKAHKVVSNTYLRKPIFLLKIT